MKITFICQTVDEKDPIQASTISWIETFSKHPQISNINVISLRKGCYKFDQDINVRAFKSRNRILTLLKFYKEVIRALFNRTDCFFIYQSGPYPLLLWPLKLLFNKPIYQWIAHPNISKLMRIFARICDNKVFSSTPSAIPIQSEKIKIIGQGIDTTRFRPLNIKSKRTRDIVTVSRVSPIKRLDLAIHLLFEYKKRYGFDHSFDIYGTTLEKDIEHRKALENLVIKLGLEKNICFKGAVLSSNLPKILNQYSLFLSFNESALDRAVVEAMACGVPPLTTNKCVEEMLPADQKKLLIMPENNLPKQIEQLHSLLMQNTSHAQLRKTLRSIIIKNHNIVNLIDKIISEISGLTLL